MYVFSHTFRHLFLVNRIFSGPYYYHGIVRAIFGLFGNPRLIILLCSLQRRRVLGYVPCSILFNFNRDQPESWCSLCGKSTANHPALLGTHLNVQTEIIAVQRVYYNQSYNFGCKYPHAPFDTLSNPTFGVVQWMIVMSTQLIGFSIGGVSRRFLVDPPSMSTFL